MYIKHEEDSNTYINEENSDMIICPYCSKEYEPSYEDTYIGGEPVDCYTENIKYYTCDKCHKKFSMYAYVEWKYCTETIPGEMTIEEFEQL